MCHGNRSGACTLLESFLLYRTLNWWHRQKTAHAEGTTGTRGQKKKPFPSFPISRFSVEEKQLNETCTKHDVARRRE